MVKKVQAEPVAVVWFLAAAARRNCGRSIIVSHRLLDLGFLFLVFILLFFLFLLRFSCEKFLGQKGQAMSLLILSGGSAIVYG